MRTLTVLVLTAALGFLWSPGPAAQTASEVKRAVFSAVEKRIIEEFYGTGATAGDRYERSGSAAGHGKSKGKSKHKAGKSKSMPPGLAKRSELPPGLAKREVLPPGLAKRDLPRELETRLPRPPYGVKRVIVDDNVVLVEKATGVVLDILEHVLRSQ